VLPHVPHKRIVTVYGVCTDPPHMALVMELCETSLDKRLDTLREFKAPVPKVWPKRRLRIARELCEAVSYLHDCKLIHRDIKPGNVLLDEDEHVKLTDFGFAKLKSSAESVQHTMVGTVAYMAPEVIRAEAHSFPADVFSAAIVLYELLTLQKPFDTRRGSHAINTAVLAGQRPQWPAAVTSDASLTALRALIDSMWHADPNKRPKMPDVVKVLNQLCS
jgi:serine/threonine protein kinase